MLESRGLSVEAAVLHEEHKSLVYVDLCACCRVNDPLVLRVLEERELLVATRYVDARTAGSAGEPTVDGRVVRVVFSLNPLFAVKPPTKLYCLAPLLVGRHFNEHRVCHTSLECHRTTSTITSSMSAIGPV